VSLALAASAIEAGAAVAGAPPVRAMVRVSGG